MTVEAPSTVDEYIAAFPAEVQARLAAIRSLVRELAPDAVERIAYGMPGYRLNGNLVYFAGYKQHIGFYGAAGALDAFADDVAPYRQEKGTLRFPHSEPLPLDLLRAIVEFRAAEQRMKPQ